MVGGARRSFVAFSAVRKRFQFSLLQLRPSSAWLQSSVDSIGLLGRELVCKEGQAQAARHGKEGPGGGSENAVDVGATARCCL